jgi:prophage tail gpP-like protein
MPDPVITLKAAGFSLTSFDALTVQRDLDAFADSFSFTMPSRDEIRAKIKPRGYETAEVWFGSSKVITGRIEKPSSNLAQSSLNLEGRSATAVMLDCSMPSAPGYTVSRHQWGGLTLGKIAKVLADPFGVRVSLPNGDSVALPDPTVSGDMDKPGDFLQGLAHDLGWVFNADAEGQLELLRPNPKGKPMANLVEGLGGLLDVDVSVDGTQFFSEFKVIWTAGGFNSQVGSSTDPGVKQYRPTSRIFGSGTLKEVNTAAKWDRATSYANAVSISAEVGDWQSDAGEFWEPGRLVTLYSPKVWINKPTPLMISGVNYRLSAGEGRKATLRLVMPSTYSGEPPEAWPWD